MEPETAVPHAHDKKYAKNSDQNFDGNYDEIYDEKYDINLVVTMMGNRITIMKRIKIIVMRRKYDNKYD